MARAGSLSWLAEALKGTEPSLTKLASPVLLKSAVTKVCGSCWLIDRAHWSTR